MNKTERDEAVSIRSVDELDWTRKASCKDCPFLKSSKFHEGIASNLPSYAESISEGKLIHTCHKTDNREGCDGPRNYKGEKPQHCYGAIMMMLKSYSSIPTPMPILEASRKNLLRPGLLYFARRARKDTKFFTWKEMISFYAKGIEEHYAAKEDQL